MLTVNFDQWPLEKGDLVLDLGCGEGRHTIAAYLQQEVASIGIDLRIENLKTTRQRFADFEQDFGPGHESESDDKAFGLARANALQLPFAENSFDKVICSEVLEHIEDYKAVLDEIERVLKPGGLLCVSVPRTWPESICWMLSKAYHNVEGGHIRIFNSKALKSAIEATGLSFHHRHWAHALHSPFWWLKCLFWRSQENNWLIKQYHRFLVWDLMDKPAFTRNLEALLNPVLGKSVVMYFSKEGGT